MDEEARSFHLSKCNETSQKWIQMKRLVQINKISTQQVQNNRSQRKFDISTKKSLKNDSLTLIYDNKLEMNVEQKDDIEKK